MLRAAGSSSLCIWSVGSCPLAFLELWESLLAGAALWEGLQPLTLGPLLPHSLFSSSLFPLLPSVTMESEAQAHHPSLQHYTPSPEDLKDTAPSLGKREFLGGSVVAISERDLNLAPVLSPTWQCPGLSCSTDPILRPPSPWEGSYQNAWRERDWGQVPIPASSLLGLESFLKCLGKGLIFLPKLSACWK